MCSLEASASSLRREMLQTHQCRSTHSNLAVAQIICTELSSAACWKLQPPLVPVARVICPWRILFFQWRQESKLYWTQSPRRGRQSSGKPLLKCCSPSNGASVLCCLLQSHTHSPHHIHGEQTSKTEGLWRDISHDAPASFHRCIS